VLNSDRELNVGDVITLDGLEWTVTGVVRNIPVNPNLSLNGCWKMVNSVNTFKKAKIAEEWLTANKVINNDQYNDMMMALSYLVREMYHTAQHC